MAQGDNDVAAQVVAFWRAPSSPVLVCVGVAVDETARQDERNHTAKDTISRDSFESQAALATACERIKEWIIISGRRFIHFGKETAWTTGVRLELTAAMMAHRLLPKCCALRLGDKISYYQPAATG